MGIMTTKQKTIANLTLRFCIAVAVMGLITLILILKK